MKTRLYLICNELRIFNLIIDLNRKLSSKEIILKVIEVVTILLWLFHSNELHLLISVVTN